MEINTSIELVDFKKNTNNKISIRRNIRTAVFPAAKFPYGKISLRRNLFKAKFPTVKFPTAKFTVTGVGAWLDLSVWLVVYSIICMTSVPETFCSCTSVDPIIVSSGQNEARVRDKGVLRQNT